MAPRFEQSPKGDGCQHVEWAAWFRLCKRNARRIAGPTPADLARYDAWMERWSMQQEQMHKDACDPSWELTGQHHEAVRT